MNPKTMYYIAANYLRERTCPLSEAPKRLYIKRYLLEVLEGAVNVVMVLALGKHVDLTSDVAVEILRAAGRARKAQRK